MDASDAAPADVSPRAVRLAELKRQLPRCVTQGWSGVSRCDGENPAALWQPGTIGEWLSPSLGSGTATLAWRSLASFLPQQGLCTIVDSGRTCCAPAIAGWGIDLRRLLVIHPAKPQEAWWAIEQSLRSRGVAATCAWVDRVPERTLRRWQLAAEVGGGIGLFFRPVETRREPSWAEFRVLVSSVSAALGDARRLRMELLYRRGGLEGRAQVWELDHDEGDLQLVSPLANSTPSRSATSA
ncbi:MAG TPA: hypothetical protein VM165_19950 [Planctomycetaceae bacterium]|nr:hypothetical protein [Planctomycetaceae bacterium]